MNTEELTQLVVDALEELKCVNLHVIDVRGKTSITDVMVIATGTSSRHVRSLAEHAALMAK